MINLKNLLLLSKNFIIPLYKSELEIFSKIKNGVDLIYETSVLANQSLTECVDFITRNNLNKQNDIIIPESELIINTYNMDLINYLAFQSSIPEELFHIFTDNFRYCFFKINFPLRQQYHVLSFWGSLVSLFNNMYYDLYRTYKKSNKSYADIEKIRYLKNNIISFKQTLLQEKNFCDKVFEEIINYMLLFEKYSFTCEKRYYDVLNDSIIYYGNNRLIEEIKNVFTDSVNSLLDSIEKGLIKTRSIKHNYKIRYDELLSKYNNVKKNIDFLLSYL